MLNIGETSLQKDHHIIKKTPSPHASFYLSWIYDWCKTAQLLSQESGAKAWYYFRLEWPCLTLIPSRERFFKDLISKQHPQVLQDRYVIEVIHTLCKYEKCQCYGYCCNALFTFALSFSFSWGLCIICTSYYLSNFLTAGGFSFNICFFRFLFFFPSPQFLSFLFFPVFI